VVKINMPVQLSVNRWVSEGGAIWSNVKSALNHNIFVARRRIREKIEVSG
jgi:hypothetical protein